MNLHHLSMAIVILFAAAACATRPPTQNPEDMAATVQSVAFTLLTQTAGAASPTPAPTETPIPIPTETPTPNITVTPEHSNPITNKFAGCYFGPGDTFILESNIKPGKRVELLGLGSEPGWYIIRNPYFHRPCWIAFDDLKLDPGVNVTDLPIMTPGVPLMGQ